MPCAKATARWGLDQRTPNALMTSPTRPLQRHALPAPCSQPSRSRPHDSPKRGQGLGGQPGERPATLTPTIADAIYKDILTTLAAIGRQIERTPAAYEGKGEEALRDLFLLPLEANFEGAATGETFNKSGKTDLLLRHDGHNLFVAECKFWGGAETLRRAIDQLLGYLTFRDSKAALLIFVRNKGISDVLGQIEQVLREHPQFISVDAQVGESEWRATFSLPGDAGLRVQMAVLLFHTANQFGAKSVPTQK